jgi:hypothetical protein
VYPQLVASRETHFYRQDVREHVENGTKYPEEEKAMNTVIWKCEQYIAGKLHEKTIFESEQQAKDFARKLYDVRPDTILRIEPMPIQHVWN